MAKIDAGNEQQTLFDEPDHEGNIRFDDVVETGADPSSQQPAQQQQQQQQTFPMLVAASIVKMVDQVTRPTQPDAMLLDDILLTLPAIMPQHHFAALLLLRIHWAMNDENNNEDDLHHHQHQHETDRLKRAVLYRTLSVFVQWIDGYWERDFAPHGPLVVQLQVNFQMLFSSTLYPEAKAVVMVLIDKIDGPSRQQQMDQIDFSNDPEAAYMNSPMASGPGTPTSAAKRRPRSNSSLGQRLSRSISQTRRRSASLSVGTILCDRVV